MNAIRLIICFSLFSLVLTSCKPSLEKSYKDEELTLEISNLRRLYVYIKHLKEVKGVDQISINDLRDHYPDIGLEKTEGGKLIEKWTYHEKPKQGVIAITKKDFDGVFLELMSDGLIRRRAHDSRTDL